MKVLFSAIFGATMMGLLSTGGITAKASTIPLNTSNLSSVHSIAFWNQQIGQYLNSLTQSTLSTANEDSFQEGFILREEKKGLSRETIVRAANLGFFSHPGVPAVVVASVSETRTKLPKMQSQRVYTHSPNGWILDSAQHVFGVDAAPGYQNMKLGIIKGKSALLSATGRNQHVQLDLWEANQWRPVWYKAFTNATYVTLSSVQKFHLEGDSPQQNWALVNDGKSLKFAPVPYVSNEPYLYVSPLTIHTGKRFWITGWVPAYANRGREIEIWWQSPKCGMTQTPWFVRTSASGTFRVQESFPKTTPAGTYTISVLLDRTGTGMILLESYENVVK